MIGTEQEWLECTEPVRMIMLVEDAYSDRKFRLWSCACLRMVWPSLTDENMRQSVEVAEKYADCLATDEELATIHLKAHWLFEIEELHAASQAEYELSLAATWVSSSSAFEAVRTVAHYSTLDHTVGSELCRDIFGNPFRPVTLDPRWLTSNVVDLAQAIYQERAYEKMPILADALMDAGCDSEEIIQHCRGDGPHVRGCWVVDLLTGRE